MLYNVMYLLTYVRMPSFKFEPFNQKCYKFY